MLALMAGALHIISAGGSNSKSTHDFSPMKTPPKSASFSLMAPLVVTVVKKGTRAATANW